VKERDLIKKKVLGAGVLNISYLLAMKANTQLNIDIGKKWGSYTSGKEL
jgi:hypothetical protein